MTRRITNAQAKFVTLEETRLAIGLLFELVGGSINLQKFLDDFMKIPEISTQHVREYWRISDKLKGKK